MTQDVQYPFGMSTEKGNYVRSFMSNLDHD
jgi:hypothetical protein